MRVTHAYRLPRALWLVLAMLLAADLIVFLYQRAAVVPVAKADRLVDVRAWAHPGPQIRAVQRWKMTE